MVGFSTYRKLPPEAATKKLKVGSTEQTDAAEKDKEMMRQESPPPKTR